MATDIGFHNKGSRSFCVELFQIKQELRHARWASAVAARRVPESFDLRRADERREYFAYPKGGVGCQTSALVSPAATFAELN